MIRIDSMSINITDICNMQCPFCLRGDGTDRKMDLSLIPRMFEGIDVIECITITGGEPSCYVEAVKAIVDYLVKNKDNIHVKGFCIITNGKKYCEELVDAVKTMLFLHLEREYNMQGMVDEKLKYYKHDLEETLYMFSIAVSIDMYHEKISFENWFKYRLSGIYSDSKECDYSKTRVIARGRGAGIPNSRYVPYTNVYVEKEDDDIIAEEIYVTIEGDVFGDCDMSYEMEDYTEPAGNLEEETLAEIIQRLVKKVED